MAKAFVAFLATILVNFWPSVHIWAEFCGSSVPGGGFCPQAGAFLWMRRGNVAACPRRRCLAWKFGAWRWLLSTGGGFFVDAEGKCCRLSTQRVPSVDALCQGVTFGGLRTLRFRLFSVFKISNSKKRKMLCCREENFTQNVVREGVCC